MIIWANATWDTLFLLLILILSAFSFSYSFSFASLFFCFFSYSSSPTSPSSPPLPYSSSSSSIPVREGVYNIGQPLVVVFLTTWEMSNYIFHIFITLERK
ncbi:unnamed protein product [Arctogadus glacialis]